ncbi:MAG: LPS biosynthesis protein [Gammaproteobacteria bacterium 28-57-27]|nr:MAG: LPS biosynthesis protein [Gammaproteobacteria bacterium 28-57-27]
MKLSVVLITLNEAERLRSTLEAVVWADEIVVLDAGSTDATLEVARRFTDKVVVDADWQGFGVQKNRALALATGDWVLSLDADEVVPPALAQEIRLTLQNPDAEAYAIPRLSSFLGRDMRHSGWWPDEVVRLFRRGTAQFSADLVHERLMVEGEVGRLQQPLHHASFSSLEQVLDKVNRYSSAGAERLAAQGRKASLGTAIGRGLWTFFRTYVLKAGFLDGREGFMLAVSNAQGVYYRYLKLMLLNEKASP